MLLPDLGNVPHPPHRGHSGQRGRMACQPCPRQHTWLQRASRQLQGQGGREKKDAQDLIEHVRSARGVCNEVRCCPFPTSRRTPFHHCLTPALKDKPNATSLHWEKNGSPYSLQLWVNRSLMWPYHITGTPGCSTPKVDNQHSLG